MRKKMQKTWLIQSNRKRAPEITISLENAESALAVFHFLFRMRFALVYFIIRKLPFPFLRLHRQGHENAGDVMGHKCAGLFDMMYYVCAQMQRTIEIPRHPQAKTTDKPPKTWMPLQHQQNTSQTRLRIHARPNSTHAIDQYLQPQQCGFRQIAPFPLPFFFSAKALYVSIQPLPRLVTSLWLYWPSTSCRSSTSIRHSPNIDSCHYGIIS